MITYQNQGILLQFYSYSRKELEQLYNIFVK